MCIRDSLRPNGNNDEMYYTFDIDDGRIKKIYINDRDMGKVNFGMNIYIMAVSYTHLDVYKRQEYQVVTKDVVKVRDGASTDAKELGLLKEQVTLTAYGTEAVSYTHLDVYKRQAGGKGL